MTTSGPVAWLLLWPRAAVRFLAGPVSPLPLGVYRCVFGVLAVVNGVLLAPDLDAFFGAAGVLPVPPGAAAGSPFRIDVIAWMGSTPAAVRSVFVVSMVAAVLTALGLGTRVATIALFVTTASFHHRDPCILSSGDTLMRIMSFLLALAPSGAAFSLDALLRSRRGRPVPATIPGTAVRVMQLQVCIAYLATGVWKACGETWRDGTAVFLVLQLGQFRRFPLPAWAATEWFGRVATWSTLGLELLAPFLLWGRRTRLPTLATLVAFHAALEYALSIQLFQPVMAAGLVLFLTEDELRAALRLPGRLLAH